MVKLLVFIGLFLVLSVTHGLPTSRIIGGQEAYAGQFPHQVSLRKNGAHTCGGSIISPTVVLTALHCVDGADPATLSVRLGSTERFLGGVVINVVKIIQHESYDNFMNDVALVFLEKPIIYSRNIQPAKLASRPTPANATVLISGWGRLTLGGDIPQKLQLVNVEMLSTEECAKALPFDASSIICLGHPSTTGACNGDSGGPAMYNGEVVGICGFNMSGCESSTPDGYASVYYHYDWIKKNAGL